MITEKLSEKSKWLDRLEASQSLEEMLKSQIQAANSLYSSLGQIYNAIDATVNILREQDNGRLIYCGAGSSARIAVQDGVELFPTFNWPQRRVEFVIAGGTNALISSIENAEDDAKAAVSKIEEISLSEKDVFIGLSASGTTKFTVSAINAAREAGATTIGIANNPGTELLELAKYDVFLKSGPEALPGSTRLAAGTAQKICLNLISTQIMVMLGYVKDGLMSEMVPRNEKLRRRRAEIDALLGRN